jgi:hypothetical protein
MGHRAGGNNSTWEIACLLSLKYYFLFKEKENNKLFIIHQYSNLFRMSHNFFIFCLSWKDSIWILLYVQTMIVSAAKLWVYFQFYFFQFIDSVNRVIFYLDQTFYKESEKKRFFNYKVFFNSYTLSTNAPCVPLALISFHLSEKCLVVWNAFWYFWCVNWK